MKKKEWKLYQSIGQNDGGFTLLEVLVAVSITSLGVLLLSFFVNQSVHLQQEVKSDRQIEWHLFLNQIEYDLKESVLVNVNSNSLVVEKHNENGVIEKVTYEKYLRMYRRKVGDKGHQPVLTQIEKFSLEMENSQLWFTVIFQNGETYTGRLYISELAEPKAGVL